MALICLTVESLAVEGLACEDAGRRRVKTCFSRRGSQRPSSGTDKARWRGLLDESLFIDARTLGYMEDRVLHSHK